ncbi:MAG: amino acid adenylation domain-containing protein, partial [Candidatus Gracilibacteria bacterium]|nr:amino acid adenylation domain-containing protein [Candidatus Gracilibacteria bacterium]
MQLIFDCLELSAQKYADKEALVCGKDRMSFGQFNCLANKVANFLVGSGIPKGGRVGIILRRSNEYVCVDFGIMKAGGCYVPIDHAFPLERMFQIISDCQIRIIFTDALTCRKIMRATDIPASLKDVVLMDDPGQPFADTRLNIIPFEKVRLGQDTFARQQHGVIDSDLAYIMHTSGSTGKPKGVMISHGNIMTFIRWCQYKLEISCEERLLNLTPFTFDVSGLDIFNTVVSGATMVITDPYPVINKVFACMRNEKITFVSTVPTNIGLMLSQPQLFQEYDLSSIKTFASGAAVCPPIFMKQLHDYLPQAKLYNLYGPTEATIYCAYYQVDPALIDVNRPLPIGIPFENTESYVVDVEGKEVPTGEIGELILRGPQVSCGYFNDPEKTEAAFRPFVIMPHLNEKVYHTGDMVKKDEEGNVHFLGRRDDMIKSRGYRIELNEIEI